MIRLLAWSMALVAASTACGTSNRPDPEPSSDPVGFTFHTAPGSLSSIGWTGVFHNIKGDPGAAFGVKVTSCDNGVCQFDGPVEPVDPVNRRRCLYRTSMDCTTDSDCPLDPGTNKPTSCVYIYDSPISTPLQGSDGKLGACALTYIPVGGANQPPPIRGKLNLVSGGLDIESLTVLLVLNGKPDGSFVGVCPVCEMDPTPNDGKKEGTCNRSMVPDPTTGNIDPGSGKVKCDVNRYGDLPGYSYGYSMDCAPTLLPTPGTTPFGGKFSSSAYTISITDSSPDCKDPRFANANCFCGMCNDSSRLVCTKDSDCNTGVSCIGASIPPGDPSNMMNVPVGGNFCDGGACNWNEAAGAGTCPSAALGRTVGCYPSASDGSKDRTGKTVSINAPGRNELDRGVYVADTASAICTPAGMNPAVNRQVGLPGLTFQKRNFRIIPEFPEGQK
jgi:hypothetical protein